MDFCSILCNKFIWAIYVIRLMSRLILRPVNCMFIRSLHFRIFNWFLWNETIVIDLLSSSAISFVWLTYWLLYFLRIVVTFGAVSVILLEFKKDYNFWVITFGIIAIIFNPLFPIYLGDKETWALIDVISAIIFCVKSLNLNGY